MYDSYDSKINSLVFLNSSSSQILGYNLTNIPNNSITSTSSVTSLPVSTSTRMKRTNIDVENFTNDKQAKRARKLCQDTTNDRQSFNCELCSSTFVNSTNLRQHIESFHMKTSMWVCSECKKLFTSKSNLKVHLRVHTRVKPYHCKSCNYSCMHHSSIKEHLSKIHPSVVHTSANPAYAFNSVAVPDPEDFNSADFNREAFIAEARQANEKLVAQINTKFRINSSSNSSTISSSSPKSNQSSPNLSINHQENSLINDYEDQNSSSLDDTNQSINKSKKETKNNSLNGDLLENSVNLPNNKNRQSSSPKYSSFSISSLISEARPNTQQSTVQQLTNQYIPDNLNSSNIWTYSNQIQLFYTYLHQLQQQQHQQNCFQNYFNFKN